MFGVVDKRNHKNYRRKTTGLLAKTGGSITIGESKLLWLRLILLPECNAMMSLRRTFNGVLEETLVTHKCFYCFLMETIISLMTSSTEATTS